MFWNDTIDFDAENFIVGRCSSIGQREAKVTLYKSDGAARLAHARAFVDAMEEIKYKLTNDRDEIASLLQKSAPVDFDNVYE